MTLINTVKALEQRETTPAKRVAHAIKMIECTNPEVNAVVSERFDQARLEAQRDYSKTQFKGTPILIKCLGQNMSGEPSTAASRLLEKHTAASTDAFVKALQDLGFIILGQTNSPEFGFKNITDPALYGPTRMFRHPDYSPGGSSGGAASALMARMVPVVAASDGGGSIRIPASYCGLIGLKPTRGSMPVGPNSYRGWQGASINFFLTHTLEDTQCLFNAMKTQQLESPFTYTEASIIPDSLTIAYSLDSPVGLPISKDAEKALVKTIQHLKDLGHTVIEATPNIDGNRLMETYYRVNGAETAAMFDAIQQSRKTPITINDVELTTWVMLQYGKKLRAYDLVHALNFWDNASAKMHAFHKTYDLYLTPTTAFTAPRIEPHIQAPSLIQRMTEIETDPDPYAVLWEMFEDSLARTPYTMLANITGQPAISLPLYKNSDGFHLGSHFMAAKGNEALLFHIARQLEPCFESEK